MIRFSRHSTGLLPLAGKGPAFHLNSCHNNLISKGKNQQLLYHQLNLKPPVKTDTNRGKIQTIRLL
jgi:hypothetical protein